MKIQKIKNKEAEDFLKHNFSSPTHWPNWNLLVEKHFNTEFYYLGATEHGVLKGICPVHKTKHKKFLFRMQSGQFHFIPNGGWIFSNLQDLTKEFFPTKWNSIFQSFSLPDVQEFNVNNDGCYGQLKKTLIIDLEKSLDEIWRQDIHGKRRNMIRKAENNGVVIEQVKTLTELKNFYKLYLVATQRFLTKPLTFEFFKELFFDNQNIALDIFSAYQDKSQLANLGIVSDKNYSIYWLGNNADNLKNMGQGELLQWYAIKKMKEKGCKYYDLCYIDPDKLPNIYKYKKGFSKDEYDVKLINNKPIPFRILNKVL